MLGRKRFSVFGFEIKPLLDQMRPNFLADPFFVFNFIIREVEIKLDNQRLIHIFKNKKLLVIDFVVFSIKL